MAKKQAAKKKSAVTPLARKWASLKAQKDALGVKVAAIQEKMDAMEEPLSDVMVEEGVQSLAVKDGKGNVRTVYIREELYVTYAGGNRERAMKALLKAKMLDCVMPSMQRIKALFREYRAEPKSGGLPVSVRRTFTTEKGYKIGCRKRS